MTLPNIPVIKIPVIDVHTDPLDMLLFVLGLRMLQLSKTNAQFIELIHGRHFRLQIESQDGVSRHFLVENDTIKSIAGAAPKPDFVLRFDTSLNAVKILLKGDPAAFMMGMQTGAVQMEGDFALLMWFNQAAQLIVPTIPKPVLKRIKQAQRYFAEKKAAFKK